MILVVAAQLKCGMMITNNEITVNNNSDSGVLVDYMGPRRKPRADQLGRQARIGLPVYGMGRKTKLSQDVGEKATIQVGSFPSWSVYAYFRS